MSLMLLVSSAMLSCMLAMAALWSLLDAEMEADRLVDTTASTVSAERTASVAAGKPCSF